MRGVPCSEPLLMMACWTLFAFMWSLVLAPSGLLPLSLPLHFAQSLRALFAFNYGYFFYPTYALFTQPHLILACSN